MSGVRLSGTGLILNLAGLVFEVATGVVVGSATLVEERRLYGLDTCFTGERREYDD